MLTPEFDVTLVGFPSGTTTGEHPTRALERVFGIDHAMASRMLESSPVVVKHGADAQLARKYVNALREIGAEAKVAPTNQGETACDPATSRGAVTPARQRPARTSSSRDGRSAAGPRLISSSSTEEPKELESFFSTMLRAFHYPFKGRGKFMLIGGVIVLSLGFWMGSWSFYGAIIDFFLFGYLAAYMFKGAIATGDGEDEPPDWPDFTSFWDDILLPYLQITATSLLCFGPAFGYAYYGLFSSFGFEQTMSEAGSFTEPLFLLLLVAGVIYFPMALLAVTLRRSLFAMNPFVIVPALMKTWRHYPIACVVIVLVYLVVSFVSALPGVGLPISSFLTLWLLMVEMRVLGLLYTANEAKLDWL